MRRFVPQLVVVGVLSTLMVGVAGTGQASAYVNLFRPAFKPVKPDPCAKVGDKGGIIVRQQKTEQKSIKRYAALLCGPKVTEPGTNPAQLVDDEISAFYLNGKSRGAHMMAGGVESFPWNSKVSSEPFQYLKGPGGSAPAIFSAAKNKEIKEIVQEVVEAVLAIHLALDAVECVFGAIESGGLSCVELFAGWGIEETTQLKKVATAIISAAVILIDSRVEMAATDWFYWSDNYGFWNIFGDLKPDWINPSLTHTGLGTAHTRIGVVLSNVGLDQGPDFNLGSTGAVAAPAGGKTVIGSNRNDRLRGTKKADSIDGRGRNDVLRAGRGNDSPVQGGPGNDRVFGGPGNDDLDGYKGRDLLVGGQGNDQLFDIYGPTVVRTGGGLNLVFVLDGRGDDKVHCGRSRRNLIRADRGDFVARSCYVGRSRVIRGGRRMRVHRGY